MWVLFCIIMQVHIGNSVGAYAIRRPYRYSKIFDVFALICSAYYDIFYTFA